MTFARLRRWSFLKLRHVYINFVIPALMNTVLSKIDYGHAYNLAYPEQNGVLNIVATFESINRMESNNYSRELLRPAETKPTPYIVTKYCQYIDVKAPKSRYAGAKMCHARSWIPRWNMQFLGPVSVLGCR